MARRTRGYSLAPGESLPKKKVRRLALYAGVQGWKNTEYVELLGSAIEALGKEAVIAGIAPPRLRMLHCVLFLIIHRPTHFFYDPRWGLQKRFGAELEGRALGMLLSLIGCVPVSLLNDLPELIWRRKISLVNKERGLCLVLIDPDIGQIFAPEIKNQVGPVPMAFSARTLQTLKKKWRTYPTTTRSGELSISFVGSLYEPRTSILREAQDRLSEQGVNLVVTGRALADPKIEADEYFRLLGESPQTFTTADQAFTSTKQDFPPHLVYRYIEALAAGTLLIAPSVPGAERYFTPDVHYLECPNIDYLSSHIPKILMDFQKIETIRKNGRTRVTELAESGFYWNRINDELIAHGFPRLLAER